MKEPPKPPPDPSEELLNSRSYKRLVRSGSGSGWILGKVYIEIAKTLRRFPWMVEVVRQRPMSILHPYTVEVYVTKDGSEACLSLNPSKAFCAQKGAVNEVKLELKFSRYETYEDRIREVYRSKGLLAFTTVAREYVRLI